ncbi:probable serine/threonine-protein kinase PBL7 [Glycine soja]|uniref:Putative serine/threonine-protein kinase PBL7 isoform A n=1 Tax=Glycine soja TaxID=3848 RepID=A0A445F9C7_GLYSO|nr:probable serine/threonine-protein kinase PBL7 [Glycine soja]KHN20203.1 Serine/threonine-protein kinase PBS1 [Glycine soja]RZB45404.1 putative serine/threonine-protein kinase PBL7 isoform A [Glycine soja]
MEVNTTTTVPAGPPTRNHSYTPHHLHSERHRHSHGHFPSKTILIIIALVTLVTVLFIIFVVLFLIHRQKSFSKNGTCEEDSRELHDTSSRLITSTTLNSSPDAKSGCLNGGNLSRTPAPKFRGVQVFTYRELEIATDGFSEANVIGSNGIGGHGLMYRGVLSDGTMAAIKLLHTEGKQGERAFRIAVDLLSRLHSPHSVELLGYCADQHHRLLIFEYMPNGTLHYHLHTLNDQTRPLDWWARMRIALDCARALEFLHEHAVSPVIHRDFKSNNVLLDQNLRAKVSDFGLPKMGSDKRNGQVSTRMLGTTGYLAPEYAMGKLTTKSDVYSYGVVLLELLTGRVPVDIKRAPGEHVLVSWALPRLTNREKVIEMVDPALRGQYSKKDLIQIAAIAAMCIQPEADYRPLMTDVVQSLIPLVRNQSSLSSSSSLRFQKQTPSPSH